MFNLHYSSDKYKNSANKVHKQTGCLGKFIIPHRVTGKADLFTSGPDPLGEVASLRGAQIEILPQQVSVQDVAVGIGQGPVLCVHQSETGHRADDHISLATEGVV